MNIQPYMILVEYIIYPNQLKEKPYNNRSVPPFITFVIKFQTSNI